MRYSCWGFLGTRYLVTGRAGFIGSNTVDELVRCGHSVTVLDDLSTGKERNFEAVRARIEFIQGAITDLSIFVARLRGRKLRLASGGTHFRTAFRPEPGADWVIPR